MLNTHSPKVRATVEIGREAGVRYLTQCRLFNRQRGLAM
jgi:hypothetical protein